ncbi:hypothetical protein ABH944_008254 [Caballeronia udeis]|uniref:Uncharacterized protein n=1 Tax=Caballeronia udeis TaxID=1232866 RepID=A0ABW8MXH3_9BURK
MAPVLNLTFVVVEPRYWDSYVDLLRTARALLIRQKILRDRCILWAKLFGYLMISWYCLIQLALESPFKLRPGTVWLNDIVGTGSALLSPVIERPGNRGSGRNVTDSMMSLTIGAFGIFWFGRACLFVMALDCFSWTLAWTLLTSVKNRDHALKVISIIHVHIRTAYMTYNFSGSGGGAVVGWVWGQWGWVGVCAAGFSILAVQLVRWLLPPQT